MNIFGDDALPIAGNAAAYGLAAVEPFDPPCFLLRNAPACIEPKPISAFIEQIVEEGVTIEELQDVAAKVFNDGLRIGTCQQPRRRLREQRVATRVPILRLLRLPVLQGDGRLIGGRSQQQLTVLSRKIRLRGSGNQQAALTTNADCSNRQPHPARGEWMIDCRRAVVGVAMNQRIKLSADLLDLGGVQGAFACARDFKGRPAGAVLYPHIHQIQLK